MMKTDFLKYLWIYLFPLLIGCSDEEPYRMPFEEFPPITLHFTYTNDPNGKVIAEGTAQPVINDIYIDIGYD